MADQPKEIQLEGGSYDIIRNRLNSSRDTLEKQLQKLNASRKEVFGGMEMELSDTLRIHTNNNCIAQDIVALGDVCIFGFNVHIGLRSVTRVEDVFAIYEHREDSFVESNSSLLDDEQFRTDLENLYKYYRDSHFYRFWSNAGYLYMVFQVSEKEGDFKAFKWLIKENELEYIDNRSEHEYRFPAEYEFEWIKAGRDDFRSGQHAHVSILDKVFVEAIGGDLTIKIEDNTDDGKGIYSELVENKDQQLDDGEYYYADLNGLIALKIKPYLEESRYFIFNEKLSTVVRVEAMKDSCRLLPGGQGLIFSNGYYLHTGEYKSFEMQATNVRYERKILSLNGEDHLYVFFQPQDGRYVLLPYNVIAQQVGNPILCNGYTIFNSGQLSNFRRDPEPTKFHQMQMWSTPFGRELQSNEAAKDQLLFKVGNKDIVACMSECASLIALLKKEEPYSDLYRDIVTLCGNINDTYYWLGKEEAQNISDTIAAIEDSSNTAIDEFEKVKNIRSNTAQSTREVQEEATLLFKRIDTLSMDNILIFVDTLSELSRLRGKVLEVRDLRYADTELLDSIDEQGKEKGANLEKECVRFLLRKESLKEYEKSIHQLGTDAQNIKSSVQADELDKNTQKLSGDLDLLIEIVSSLKIEDPTETTRIIERISALYSVLNGNRSSIRNKRKELRSKESRGEFDAQFRLLEQSVINYLEVADTTDKCEEYLTKVMVNLEEMEGKFVDDEKFIEQLTDKREEIHTAFETKRLQLLESRNRRAVGFASSAERLLTGIKSRALKLEDPKEISGFFASDMMIDKVRDIISKLTELGDSVKADEVAAQLSASREEVLRKLRDKSELFVSGQNIIKLGKHQFSVNTQPLDLSFIPRDNQLMLHLTGSNFFLPIEDELLNEAKDLWQQHFVSESDKIYRSEYLLHSYLNTIGGPKKAKTAGLLKGLQDFASTRLNEGYEKGVHDVDAAAIGQALLQRAQEIDLLYASAVNRALAQYYWRVMVDQQQKEIWKKQIKTAAIILKTFPESQDFQDLIAEIECDISKQEIPKLLQEAQPAKTAQYLFDQLLDSERFVISQASGSLQTDFLGHLKTVQAIKDFQASTEALKDNPEQLLNTIYGWLKSYCAAGKISTSRALMIATACHLAFQNKGRVIPADTIIKATDLKGDHPVIEAGAYNIHYHEFFDKLDNYRDYDIPRLESYHKRKKQLTEHWREKMRLEELKPQVLSSFIRNKLIDNVYLPVIGDNLAKQIGTVGENTRTDRMGLLLLISPPGYGKTTLMEYIADRLGLTFVKVNGPAIGHEVTSVDPEQAPNSAARQELEKLNMSFEIGDNLMIYVDDIQHCSPEFLQKFISLCDGQRKIEGTYNGKSKTYDFRGKKVAVVMAGNPYTESGEKFQIPDMLANRADVYNLGDILAGAQTDFENSYIENCLTSNPTLKRLANKSMADVYTLLSKSNEEQLVGLDLEGKHSPEEIKEYLSVLRKLKQIRDVILKVNQEYIKSAAMSDEYRTAPPFKLQGSYRNMNKLAEKVVPVMNDEEVNNIILDHYNSEAQALTKNAEANLLLFKQLIDQQSPEEKQRLDYILSVFREQQAKSSANNMQAVIREMQAFNDLLKEIADRSSDG